MDVKASLKIWFLDVGHGDCAYIEFPNGANMMIDCGGDSSWPSKLLKHCGIAPKEGKAYGLDNLVISHPHGDHYSDIIAIHEDIKFKLLTGGYNAFIDKIDVNKMDFRKRNNNATQRFIKVVKQYTGGYVADEDNVLKNKPVVVVNRKRFLNYEEDMDLNDISLLTSLTIGPNKVLFTGDITAAGINKILDSDQANDFIQFVKGTTIIKIPHHGRENGCSDELFECIESEVKLGIASDKVLDGQNEGTANIQWYRDWISDDKVMINKEMQDRWVLTTRKDGDIYLEICSDGSFGCVTNCFRDLRAELLEE